jgi:hypothetical protein
MRAVGRVAERGAGVCAVASAVIWALQYLHALATHGPTGYNRAKVLLGMTWFDSGKFLVLSFLLLVPAAMVMGRRAAGRGRPLPGRTALLITALGASAVTTAMQFWTADWGSYVGTSNPSGLAYWGGPLQAMSSAIVLPVAFGMVGVAAARVGALPWWLVPLLVVGAVATVFLAGPTPPVAGIAWLALGTWLLTAGSTIREPVTRG